MAALESARSAARRSPSADLEGRASYPRRSPSAHLLRDLGGSFVVPMERPPVGKGKGAGPRQRSRHVALSALFMLCCTLAAFLFRYHTALGGGLMGSKQQAVGGAAGAAAAAVFLSGDSGAGVSTLAGMSAAELSQLLTPGSSGRGPFDLAKYPGFCRKMRPPNVPVLTVQRMWLSNRQRNATDVSLVTQLSVDRLYMLEAQCGSWGSIISASVHVPLVQGRIVSELPELAGKDAATPLELISDFHERMEKRGRCKLDLVYVTEEVGTIEQVGLYPVNALRNKALQLSQTEIVLLLDADFLPNRALSDMIHDQRMYDQLRRVTGYRQGIVLPAFETIDDGEEGKSTALKAIKSRDVLHELFKRGELRGFHMDHYNRGHRATDHSRWFETNISYRIPYEEGFEPYVLVQRRFVPWYDERFKGYRKNKVVHLMHMFRLGLEFASTPHGYVVHSPHPVANSWNTTQATGFWYKLKKLYADSREDMAASTFVPATSFNCDSREPERWSFYLRRLRWSLSA
ncbi:Glycosyltransferase LARGE2 [Micractinium conductrix]|uniref:Glycosyltransferase LARGE2 n=1 Tax=Micractinium conductrix TaxID=554055 RepID=A0A2P6VGE4_9CHLO|nr:Glycosyltransferase LARGE2 [Micractinium conductrix]|eukprot:PSC73160.1 Glycosyltransferase LARGE2 [Micractinium conductrix]